MHERVLVVEDDRSVRETATYDVHRLQGLVLELVELARLDAGEDDGQLEVLSLREAVSAVLRAWDGRPPVHSDIGADLVVMAHRVRFNRLVQPRRQCR